ncbi:hypothetical protein Q8F55_004560 [Vanrija albida]|uniref:Fe2OG dioxygenase domain-containing protein n=1 Tax=Vanrija albida TaxID=181172 RepID=A0ABR3Q7D1_9TREE
MALPTALPVLSLADLDGGAEARAAFVAALAHATHAYGFFYLTDTGLSPELESRLPSLARDFFALPDAAKLEIESINSAQFRGYTRLGGERTKGQVDWREQIDIGPEGPNLDSEAAAREAAGAPPHLRLLGPNQWPSALPELRPAAEEWIAHLQTVAFKLLSAWSLALGQEEDYFAQCWGESFPLLKIVRYPGATDESAARAQGVGAHKDAAFVTLLWVEPGADGLQVQLGEEEADGSGGVWVDAPPVPGAFVVNIGEMLEYATQGYLKATRHRVQAPPNGRDRLSLPFFFNPQLDAQIPLVKLPAELQAKARGVTRDPTNAIYPTYGENQLKSRLRAHPDVSERHHADLLRKAREAGENLSGGAYA